MTTYEVRVEVIERESNGPHFEIRERVLWKCSSIGLDERSAHALFEEARNVTVMPPKIPGKT